MKTLCIILARAGSKGLPAKNVALLLGRPLIAYTIEHARAASRVDRVAVSTDGPAIAAVARGMGAQVVARPPHLATDTATVDSAARHAVEWIELSSNVRFDAVVILYGNVPLRPGDLIDRAVAKLVDTGCDSVQSVSPVGKMHPFWMKTLGGEGRDVLEHYQPNSIYRRQDLPPVFMLDGGIIAVTRASLFSVIEGQPHAFLGADRRALVTQPGDVVDIDTPIDLALAEATLASRKGRASGSARRPSFTIGSRSIGGDHPAYVIAELGVNHDGSIARALELTRAARLAGADAVKLQLFDPRLLLSSEAALADYQQGSADDVFEMLAALQLDAGAMARVRDLAHELELGFIVTPFSIELLEAMKMLGPDAVKIASPDAVNLPLIEMMLGLSRPMLISTGTCAIDELSPAVALLRGRPAALLHCVSAYPVAPDRADLTRIGRLAGRFGLPVGYSDHTTDLHGGMLAVASQGAVIVERHLTYDRAAAGPDHAASLDAGQFARYVQLIRAGESTLRVPAVDDDTEAEVRRLSRQSVCTKRDLRAGAVLGREDVTVKRPGTGIPAGELETVVGRRLSRDLAANSILRRDDLQSAEAAAALKDAPARRRSA
jgi:sialic acid synthase SpsE/CMP-N-acetylneuraminic acid synthetase